MDLVECMSNRELLKMIGLDMIKDVRHLQAQPSVSLLGNAQAEDLGENEFSINAIRSLEHLVGSDCQLWELQYMFLVCVYLSDTLVNSLLVGTNNKIINVWYDGIPDKLPSFRQRFQYHLLGKYAPKKKKGSRKTVTISATTPNQAAISEFLLIHTILGNH